MKLSKAQIKNIIKEELKIALQEKTLDPEIVAEQVILQFIAGRNASGQLDSESLLSALAGPSARQYLERYGVTYENIAPSLSKVVQNILNEIKTTGNFKVYERDNKLVPDQKGPNNVFVVTLSNNNKFVLDKETA